MAVAQFSDFDDSVSIEGLVKDAHARHGGNKDKAYYELLALAKTNQTVEDAFRRYLSIEELVRIVVARQYMEVRREINRSGSAVIRNPYKEPMAKFGIVEYTIPYLGMGVMTATFEELQHAERSLVGDMKGARLAHQFVKCLLQRVSPGERVGQRWTPDEIRKAHQEIYGWI